MSGGPFLSTARFDLWQPQASDLDGLCRLLADEETRSYLGRTSADPPSQWERLVRNAGSWSIYGYGTLYARAKGGGMDIIANCGVFHSWRGLGKSMDDEPEAGWIVRRDHWGCGVASEIMEAVLAWFDTHHGPRRTVCMIEVGNTASQRIAARLGYQCYERTTAPDNGAMLDLYERRPG